MNNQNTPSLRNSKKVRLWTIGGLIALAAVLLFFVKSTAAKAILGGMIAILLVAFGMEAKNTDYDVQKLVETKSFSSSRVLRDASGNIVDPTSPAAKNAKYTDEYNCDDFKNQTAAQNFFEKAGGVSADTNRLDGNKDGVACQSLPKK